MDQQPENEYDRDHIDGNGSNENGSNGYNGYGSSNEYSRNGYSSKGGAAYPLVEVRRTVQPQVYTKRSPSVLPLVSLCTAVCLGIVLVIWSARQPQLSDPIPKTEAFRWGVNRAMSAAELTQTAQTVKEWQQVVGWWQDAIKLMQTVPSSDQHHRTAVAKISEYQDNLRYAQGRSKEALSQSGAANLWGVGSRRALVLKLQGQPTKTERYDSICKEVFYYGSSQVEFNNGSVVQYDDFDRNLKATLTQVPAPRYQTYWDLGSAKAEVFRIQGTPNRIEQYDYSDLETLHYGNSTVEIEKQRVVGYDNRAQGLQVRTVPIQVNPNNNSPLWRLASSREDVLRVQGTPTRVLRSPSNCAETFYYGNSTVTFKNGFIAGYDNSDRNLSVQAQ
jgi:hypothetical protein